MIPLVLFTRVAIVVHRWLGVAVALLFLIWFPSAIGIMYWDFPSVDGGERIAHAAPIEVSRIRLSPQEAAARLDDPEPPRQVRLETFDGRPVYRFGPRGDDRVIYADTGDEQIEFPTEMLARIAAAWTKQPAASATVTAVETVDQWMLQTGVGRFRPLWKYSWPDGQQVYVSGLTGEVVQYTTTASRWGAYVGAIPHWLYFTPLRRNGALWSRVVIWGSGIGTATAVLGMAIGLWMYSPSKRYRYAGAPTSIPYRGQKRWHTLFGLVFGVGAVTWAFSGLLSMEPFPSLSDGRPPSVGDGGEGIMRTLSARPPVSAFAAKDPRVALAEVGGGGVRTLEFAGFAGEPVYLATIAPGETRVVPLAGAPQAAFDPQRVIEVVTRAAVPKLAEARVLHQYDRYYLDRRRQKPLPVILARIDDDTHTRLYIDPKTARVVGGYRDGDWFNRWLYHGLHSLDFPWLYNYRPLWDLVVLTFMIGGTALCVTSLVLAWRVLGRKLRLLAQRRDDLVTETATVD